MPVFVVSYDLTRPYDSYCELWEALDALGARRVLLFQHAANVNATATALRDHLWQHMDPSDSLLVMARDSEDWASMRAETNLDAI